MTQHLNCLLILMICAGQFTFPASPVDAQIECCGLTLERLQYGLALTDRGIMFAQRIGEDLMIWEHVPFAEYDLQPVIDARNSEFLWDILYSNSFVIFDGTSYRICDVSDTGMLHEPVIRVPISSPSTLIYASGSGFVFIVFQGVYLDAVYVVSDDGSLTQITDTLWKGQDKILDCQFLDGTYYLLTQQGLCLTEEIGNAQFFAFPETQTVEEDAALRLCCNRLFVEHGHHRSLSEVVYHGKQAQLVNTRTFVDLIQDVHCVQDRILVSYHIYGIDWATGEVLDEYEDRFPESVPVLQLQDWDTGEVIEGCEDAWLYVQIGGVLYGIRKPEILVPYR